MLRLYEVGGSYVIADAVTYDVLRGRVREKLLELRYRLFDMSAGSSLTVIVFL